MSFDNLWLDNNFRHNHQIPRSLIGEDMYSLSEVKRVAKAFYAHGLKDASQQGVTADVKCASRLACVQ